MRIPNYQLSESRQFSLAYIASSIRRINLSCLARGTAKKFAMRGSRLDFARTEGEMAKANGVARAVIALGVLIVHVLQQLSN